MPHPVTDVTEGPKELTDVRQAALAARTAARQGRWLEAAALLEGAAAQLALVEAPEAAELRQGLAQLRAMALDAAGYAVAQAARRSGATA